VSILKLQLVLSGFGQPRAFSQEATQSNRYQEVFWCVPASFYCWPLSVPACLLPDSLSHRAPRLQVDSTAGFSIEYYATHKVRYL
jgi:hypothetical protein